jgi:hypothetical protein
MNKKHLIYTILAIFLTTCKPSVAMYGAIFKTARAVGVTALPVYGLDKVNATNKCFEDSNKEVIPFSHIAIEEWGREKMKQLEVPDAESLSFKYNLGWSTNGKKISVPEDECNELNDALKFNKSFFSKIGFLRGNEDKLVACHSMILKHEICHIINKDPQSQMYALAAIPLGIEVVSFGATKAFRKLCNMQTQPKMFLKTMLRSGVAIGAIGPKMLMGGLGQAAFSRYKEVEADKFACEHAESRLELTEYANFFEARETKAALFDTHPCHADRREMVERYIAKWDAEHNNTVEKS